MVNIKNKSLSREFKDLKTLYSGKIKATGEYIDTLLQQDQDNTRKILMLLKIRQDSCNDWVEYNINQLIRRNI